MGKVTRKQTLIVMLTSLALSVIVSQPALAQTFNVIYSFNIGPIGVFPFAGVTLDAHGNIYGTNNRLWRWLWNGLQAGLQRRHLDGKPAL